MNNESQSVAMLAKTPKPVVKPTTPRDYAASILKIVGTILLLIAVYNGIKNTGLWENLRKVGIEVWLTLLGTAVGAWWKFATEKEKTKLTITQSNAITNAQAIRALDIRVDAVLTQLQDLNQRFNLIDDLRQKIDDLEADIAYGRQQFLKERVQIIQEFYREICQIHSHISYSKGIAEGINKGLAECEEQDDSGS